MRTSITKCLPLTESLTLSVERENGKQFSSQFKTFAGDNFEFQLTERYKSAVQHAKLDCVRYRSETGRRGARLLLLRLFDVHIPRLGSTKATSKSKVSESRLRSKRKERKQFNSSRSKAGNLIRFV